MRHFSLSIFVTIVGLILAFLWGGQEGAMKAVFITAILAILEVSLSFDNAVVNASVLKEMDAKWQMYFLTWGILIAVFGMRLVFPVAIVAIIASINPMAVIDMALNSPEQYAHHLHESHISIAAFGGMFLMMVFFSFLFDEERDIHWLGFVEQKLGAIGKMESVEIVAALLTLIFAQSFVPEHERLTALLAGLAGIVLFVLVDSAELLFESPEEGEAVTESAKRSGVAGFLYLEVLDASFSFDGVIGAFAISKDVVVIMIGLGIGAMFVRSLTVYLVRQGTLDEYVFLEHGAHYAIGALAGIMLASMTMHISEVITGLVGAAFIGLSVISSLRYKGQQGDAA